MFSVEIVLGLSVSLAAALLMLAFFDGLANAPFRCTQCGRVLDGPECPTCDD
jgi:hypothetical protein